jgi:hypothetical protein
MSQSVVENPEEQKGEFDFDLGDFNQSNNDDNKKEDPEDDSLRQAFEREMLFLVQNVGSVKSVGGNDVYVKSNDCELSLKEIIKRLKFDSLKRPIARLILSEWLFLQKDLLPLLIFHDKDKKLSFLTLMILVQMTEPLQKEIESRCAKTVEAHLRQCKEAVMEQKVISTLMSHLADCLQE